MVLNLFAIIVGGGASVLTSYFLGAFSSLSMIWLPILLWLLYYALIVGLTLLIMLIISPFLSKSSREKPSPVYFFFVWLIIDYLCVMARIKTHISGLEKIDKKSRYLIAINHRSKFDPMLLVSKFYFLRPYLVSKKENFKILMVGPFIRRAGFFAIDREDNREALKSINTASSFIKDSGVSVGVCPEGTRNLENNTLLPFRAGAFKIATKAKAPIVVMTMEGTEKIRKNFPLKRTHVYIDILDVIYPDSYSGKGTQKISDQVYEQMKENIIKYNGEIFNAAE